MRPQKTIPIPLSAEEAEFLRLLSVLSPADRGAFTQDVLRWRHLRRRFWLRDAEGTRPLR